MNGPHKPIPAPIRRSQTGDWGRFERQDKVWAICVPGTWESACLEHGVMSTTAVLFSLASNPSGPHGSAINTKRPSSWLGQNLSTQTGTTVIRWTPNVPIMHSSKKGTAESAWVPATQDMLTWSWKSQKLPKTSLEAFHGALNLRVAADNSRSARQHPSPSSARPG